VLDIGPLPVLDGDATQLRQLLQNLIANALKFHKPGEPPRITVRAEEMAPSVATADQPATAAAWRIAVADDGIGFDPAHAERIFGLFQRLHRREEYPGSGIGLAICRRIVERHGGTIRAEGTPGQGARFVILLPAKARPF